MQQYVLGFAFDLPEYEIAEGGKPLVGLIRKARPEWQAGSLNGIGGHVEKSDKNHKAAMVREFQEETGVLVPKWKKFAIMGSDTWNVYVYRAFGVPLMDMETLTDEEVTVSHASHLPLDVLPNLRWLIPLALDPQPYPIHVVYR